MPISSDSLPLPFDRLRVGECTVDIALREVHAPGARQARRITPKSMAVLLVLVENADRVVTRDTLLARVWPDTLPTNDVVTQAITQLRKALGEAQGGARYIETIAKSGYRLLATVERIATPPPVAAPATGEEAACAHGVAPPCAPQRTRSRYYFGHLAIAGIAAMGLLLSLAVAMPWADTLPSSAALADAPERPLPAALQPTMITSTPGFELAPTLSPDAAMVAYMAVPSGQRNLAIMVQTTAPTPTRQLTRPSGMDADGSPQWSPDGREIAFLRLRAGRDCTIMIVPANGGAERSVGACDGRNLPSFDWAPDGSGLIFSSRAHGATGLQLLDLRRGQWTALQYGARKGDVDLAPRYSADGRWIVFVRGTPLGDLWRVPAGGGTAERLTHMTAEIRGWDWSHDNQALIYGRRHHSESRLYRLDLGSGTTTDLGIADGEYPVVATRVPAMAYVNRRSYFGIHRVDLGTGEAGGGVAGEQLFASSGRDRLPSVAPDGRQLVFASDRSGQFGLWWADLERGSPRLIPGVRPESRYLPSWSPDSKRVLVEGTGTAGHAGIFEITPASGRVAKLPIPSSGPVQALYLPDEATADRLLVVAGGADGRLGLTLFDRSARPWRELARIDRVSLAQVDSSAKRVLFTRPGEAGLWQADLQLSAHSVHRLDGQWPATSRYQAWTVAADGGLYTTSWRADCPALLRRVGAGEPAAGALCLDAQRRASRAGFSVDARTNQAFVSLARVEGGDIGFVMLDPALAAESPGAATD